MAKLHLLGLSFSMLPLLALAHGCAGELEGDPTRFLDGSVSATGVGGSQGTGGSSAGTGGSSAGTGGGTSAACDPQPIFTASCATSIACHQGPGPSIGAGIDLSSLASIRAQTNKSTTSGGCSTRSDVFVIDTATPTNSLLYQVLGTPPCGISMPLSGNPLNADQKACVLNWIQSLSTGDGGS